MKDFLHRIKTMIFLPEGVEPTPNEFFNGDGVKLIFDHIRNMAICTVIAQGALYAMSLGGNSELGQYVMKAFGSLFTALALFLFLLNFSHGEHLLKYSHHFENVRGRKLFSFFTKTYSIIYLMLSLIACSFSIFTAR